MPSLTTRSVTPALTDIVPSVSLMSVTLSVLVFTLNCSSEIEDVPLKVNVGMPVPRPSSVTGVSEVIPIVLPAPASKLLNLALIPVTLETPPKVIPLTAVML